MDYSPHSDIRSFSKRLIKDIYVSLANMHILDAKTCVEFDFGWCTTFVNYTRRARSLALVLHKGGVNTHFVDSRMSISQRCFNVHCQYCAMGLR